MKRRIIAIMTTILLVISILPMSMISVVAETETSGKWGNKVNWSFDESTGTLTFTGSGPMYDSSVPWEDYKDKILHVKIEDGITSIGDNLLSNCSNLVDVQIPDSVKTIGSDAFRNSSLSGDIDLPNLESIEGGAFANTDITSIIMPDAVDSIGGSTFNGCKKLKTVKFSSRLKSIGMYPFAGCTAIEELTFPSTLSSISWSAFAGCTSLRKVTFEERNEPPEYRSFYIEPGAFEGCSSLKTVYFPSRLSGFDGGCFQGIDDDPYIALPGSEAPYVSTNSFDLGTTIHVTEGATGYDSSDWNNYNIVYDLPVIPVEELILPYDEVEIRVNAEKYISPIRLSPGYATFYDTSRIKWETNDSDVAMVETGSNEYEDWAFIKGKKNGTATVTGTIDNAKATIKVVVGTGKKDDADPTDNDGPTVTKIKTGPASVKPGEKVTITTVVEDKSDIDSVVALFKNNDTTISVELSEESKGTWRGEYTPDEKTASGIYELAFVRATDVLGNSRSTTFDNVKFEVKGASDDSEAPKVTEIIVSPKEVKAGEYVTVSAKVTDATGVESVYADFINQDNRWRAQLTDSGDGVWTGRIYPASDTPAGTYELLYVRATDTLGNIGTSHFDDVSYVVNSDTTDNEAPNVKGIKIDKETAALGDIITITVDAEDPSGIASMFALFRNNDNDLKIDVVENDEGKWTGSVLVNNSLPKGTYSLAYVFASDTIGNSDSTRIKDVKIVIEDKTEPAPTPSPSETVKPSESPKPSETVKPSESPKPSETVKPSESSKPSETVKPSESPKPSETVKPSESPKPSETIQPETRYSDVPLSGKWYSDAVEYVSEQGYMTGITQDKFGPNNPVTRATVVQILYAMEGKPNAPKTNAFTDVKSGEWYEDAINWAGKNGLAAGYGRGIFKPNQIVSRQELATFLRTYAQYKGNPPAYKDNLGKYADSQSISRYAIKPMQWAVGNGVIEGFNNKLDPRGKTTRAQLAVMLQAYDRSVK